MPFNTKKHVVFAGVLACLLVCSSCCSIVSTRYQNMLIVAPEKTVIERDGQQIGIIPDGEDRVSVVTRRSKKTFTMTASKDGFETVEFDMVPRMNMVVLFNVLLGPGLVIGAPVDFINGSAYEYPNYVEIHLDRAASRR